MIGSLPGENGLPTSHAVVDALVAAGREVAVPDRPHTLCCGMAFSSKAYFEAAREAAARTAEALWTATREGRDPVVTDASPCAYTLSDLVAEAARARGRALRTYDFAAYWAREVLPALPAAPRLPGPAVLHPTCSSVKGGILADVLAVARAHAEEVIVPPAAECCGFAGDRGFLFPELTASATRREADEVRALAAAVPVSGYYSTARTCEIGLSRATGRPYRSIAHLVRDAMRRG
jgi:D-lactate dehydrogenase